MDTPQRLKKRIRRGCTNRAVRDVLLRALDAGATGRFTRNGVMLYGPNGKAASVHFTQSDARSAKNTLADIRSTGLDI